MKNGQRYLFFVLIGVWGCAGKESKDVRDVVKHVGEIVVLDSALNQVLDVDATIDVMAEGFDWSEGPLWLADQQKLIWSDVPRNTIYQWTDTDNVSVYLTPSGYTSTIPRSGETGSNGLTLNEMGQLILCQHGDRRVARMDGDLSDPNPTFVTLADRFEGKRLNSPNDAAFGPNGNLYFTDPPYGLVSQSDNDGEKELDFNGVFKVTPDGKISVMTKSLSRPNGIAFNSDKTKCYVSNSDPENAVWMVYDVDANGDFINEKIFFDATLMVAAGSGLPDGMKVNKKGILFASGPGGLLIFTSEAKHLGTIHTGMPVSNCALNDDESVLFLTSDAMIVKVDLVKTSD